MRRKWGRRRRKRVGRGRGVSEDKREEDEEGGGRDESLTEEEEEDNEAMGPVDKSR